MTMTADSLVLAARDLLRLGPGALWGPRTDDFVEEVGRRHPAGRLYRTATAEAIARRAPAVDCPDEVAEGVFRNFVWTHFVCKLVMTACPEAAVDFALGHFDLSDLVRSIDAHGPGILSCFHYTGYPLVALGV